MKVLTVVGARPQFIKAAMVSRAVVLHNRREVELTIVEEIVHTGQHYDANISDIFFKQMQIPEPVVNLHAGTGNHGEMTGRMLSRIEKVILDRRSDLVLVYGDTNSTLAASLAAAKLLVPLAHVEAGLRSFNKQMPEEINRILTDHVSSLLFCPTHSAVSNLANEGITKGVHHVGDVMYDAALAFGKIAEHRSTILEDCDLRPKQYLLATVHRAENTDDPARLRSIMNALTELGRNEPVIFPIHPRTKRRIEGLGDLGPGVRLVAPLSFLDMIQLEKNARCILTDSGGVQKEGYFHGVPGVTLRDETEWVETVKSGWNQAVGTNVSKIIGAVHRASTGTALDMAGGILR